MIAELKTTQKGLRCNVIINLKPSVVFPSGQRNLFRTN